MFCFLLIKHFLDLVLILSRTSSLNYSYCLNSVIHSMTVIIGLSKSIIGYQYIISIIGSQCVSLIECHEPFSLFHHGVLI